MQRVLHPVYIFFLLIPFSLFSQGDPFFCIGLQAVVDDANLQFVQQTHRDRNYLLNSADDNRFDAELGLAGFEFEKIISRGAEGLYYEAIVPFIGDTLAVVQSLKAIDEQLLACLPGLVRNPQGDSLYYGYHYEHGDTLEEMFIRMWGTYPALDADSFFSPGQVNLEIYGDERRRFLPYTPDAKKADAVLKKELQQIEKGLLDDIKLIRGKATIDIYNNTIYKTTVKITGAGDAFIKPWPETMNMLFGYYAEFYAGPSFANAKKAFTNWDTKLKNNAFAEKRFAQKTRKRLQWDFLPYNEWFDPMDYANIVEQRAYSCPVYSEDPFNRTPLFTYHLFIMKYADNYIVGLNIGNRY